jgi:uncharacterized protein
MARCADRLEALAQRLRERHGVSARVLIADLSEDGGIDVATSSIQGESELAVLVNAAVRDAATRGRFTRCHYQGIHIR